jgi:four helix bundle protein
MKYTRFEELPAWKSAIELAERAYRLTRRRLFTQPGDLGDRLRRAALSVSNNIAEGFERGSTAELLAFLYIARGSAGEVRSMLRFSLRLFDGAEATPPEISDLKSQISDLKSEISEMISLAESCSRQIRAWANSLQNTDVRGQRHLNDQSRRAYQAEVRAESFRREIQEKFRADHPELLPPSETAE